MCFLLQYLEHEKTDTYHLAAQFLQQLPTGKIAEWEATYRISLEGKLGAKIKLLNGDQFKNCEIVSGSHFIVLCAGEKPDEEETEGSKKTDPDAGRIAVQQGQRMRDDWNLSTVEEGWGRSNLIAEEEVVKRKLVRLIQNVCAAGSIPPHLQWFLCLQLHIISY